MRRYVYVSIIAALSGLSLLVAGSANQRHWQTAAKWHRSLNKALPGTLVIDTDGIEFQSSKLKQRWTFVDIHTFDVDSHDLTLWTWLSFNPSMQLICRTCQQSDCSIDSKPRLGVSLPIPDWTWRAAGYYRSRARVGDPR